MAPNCVIPLWILGVSPLANSYLTACQLKQEEPSCTPLHAYVCEHCFLVQLEEFTSPEYIFNDYAYFSSYSDTWLQHARAYTDMAVERFDLDGQSQVIEIASNDGYLLQYFVAKGMRVLGIEPGSKCGRGRSAEGIPTVVQFFAEAMARQLVATGPQADLLIGNNVLAHAPRLNDFVKSLKILLHPRGGYHARVSHILCS